MLRVLPCVRLLVGLLGLAVLLLAFSNLVHIAEPHIELQEVGAEKGSTNFSCEGRLIFVHNVSEVFNRAFVRQCAGFKKNVDLCPYMENGGMGREMELEMDEFPCTDDRVWFNSWQFGLELYFHKRLSNYPCITNEEELANAFYVPFYAGMDLSYRMTHRQNNLALYVDLLDWLSGNVFFNRYGGLDHFISLGRIALDFRRPKGSSWGSQMLLHPDFQHMVKLTIERDGSLPNYSGNEIAVPYPTGFHHRSDAHIMQLVSWALGSSHRPFFASLAGGRRRGKASIRTRIMEQCEEDRRCLLIICQGNEADHHLRLLNVSVGSRIINTSCHNPAGVLDVFHKSQFCLQPPGDSPTRRSFFDSLLAGCIPVIFSRTSAWTQYSAFLPEDGESYSVLMPLRNMRNKSVFDALAKIPQVKIASMRAKIGELLPRVLYASTSRRYSPSVDLSINSVLQEDVMLNVENSISPANSRVKFATQDYVLERADAFDIAIEEVISVVKRNLGR